MTSKLIIIIGAVDDEDHIRQVINATERGINAWVSTLGEDEKQEVLDEINSFALKKSLRKSTSTDNEVVFQCKGKILDSTILISPTCEAVYFDLVDFFLRGSSRYIIVYGGFISEDKADWCLQDGLFSFHSFKQILKDSRVSLALSAHNSKILISCCKAESWSLTDEDLKSLIPDSLVEIKIMDPMQYEISENQSGDNSTTKAKSSSRIEQFSECMEDIMGNEVGGIFNTLKPPAQVGFLKIKNPCLYVFPAGNGDSAFFAVNGFNMLVNGGSCSKPWFWKLIQHIDRVDSILATHLGSDNLPGLNSLLLRKLQERQVKLPMDNTTPEYKKLEQYLISPDLGPLFMNTPAKFMENISKSQETPSEAVDNLNGSSPQKENNASKHLVMKTVDVVKDTLRLAKALNMEIIPAIRKPGTTEPISLFSKVGHGRLDMHVISPLEGSKELNYVNEKWGCNGKTTTPTGKTGVISSSGNEGDSAVTNISSICCLLVWHPANPNDRIVRILFPGNTTQKKIFEGLESIKNLPFVKTSFATKAFLNKLKSSSQKPASKANGHATADSRSNRQTTAPKKQAVPKKPSEVMGKREAGITAGKPAEKRPKTEKNSIQQKGRAVSAPSTSRAKPSEKAQGKSVKVETTTDKTSSKSTSSSSLKKTTRVGTAPSATKPEAKRPAAASKPGMTKAKVQTAGKTQEKPQKPHYLTTTKSKTEARKSPSKAAPSVGKVKKTPVKSSSKPKAVAKNTANFAEKAIESVSAAVTTPPEDLTLDFKKAAESGDKETEKPTVQLSSGSEEPPTSILSDRHSPEGQDHAPTIYSETLGIVAEKEGKQNEDEPTPDVVQDTQVEKEDAGFVIMNKPDLSEENNFISDNGSLAEGQHQEMKQVDQEAELLSSDMSTPTPHDEKPEGRTISFIEPEKEYSVEEKPHVREHQVLDRQPTPYHSLQENSDNTEPSQSSESTDEMDKEKAELPASEEEQQLTDQGKEMQMTEEEAEPCEIATVEAAQAKDVCSEPQSSFNSSLEGSYELHPTSRSPPPASDRQETMAETISEYKQDEEILEKADDSPSIKYEEQVEKTETLEEIPVSTDALDPSTSTGSRIAHMDSPFSPSEIGLSATSDRISPPLARVDQAQSLATKFGHTEDDISSLCGPAADLSQSTDYAVSSSNAFATFSATGGAPVSSGDNVQERNTDQELGSEEELIEMRGELQTRDFQKQEDDQENVVETDDEEEPSQEDEISDENDVPEEDMYAEREFEQKQALDNYVQLAWQQEDCEKKGNQELDLHAIQHQDNYNAHDQEQAYGDEDNMQYRSQEQKKPMCDEPGDNDGNAGRWEAGDEEDGMQMTGSLASSAQDQGGAVDYSETASLTETGATPDVEQAPVGFDYDEPNVKEYDQEDIPKSDLSLSSPEENFPLHSGTTFQENKQEVNGNTESGYLVDFQCDSTPAEEDQSGSGERAYQSSSPQRYHPAYLDPSAPLADTDDGLGDAAQQKPQLDDSGLDANAKPFIPFKTSLPTDMSPLKGAEAAPGQDDEYTTDEMASASSQSYEIAGTNPFLNELMANMGSDPTNAEAEQGNLPPMRGPDPCAVQDATKQSKSSTKKAPTSAGSSTSRKANGTPPIYVDLVYVPNHANPNSVGIDFFKRIRAKYYVISGNDLSRDEPAAEVLNHLLEGKKSWLSESSTATSEYDDNNVTVIPTHDTVTVREWYQKNFKQLEASNIHMVSSGSKVLMQDESIEACKIEF